MSCATPELSLAGPHAGAAAVSAQPGKHHHCSWSRQFTAGAGKVEVVSGRFCGTATFNVRFTKVHDAPREALRAMPGAHGVDCVLWFA